MCTVDHVSICRPVCVQCFISAFCRRISCECVCMQRILEWLFLVPFLNSPVFCSTSKNDRIPRKDSVFFPIFNKKCETINLIMSIKHNRHGQKTLPVYPRNWLCYFMFSADLLSFWCRYLRSAVTYSNSVVLGAWRALDINIF